jgi:RING-variant domain
MACRICFETEGPLYSPCKCKGSIEHIHEECLLTWIREDDERSSCELCKEPYALDYNQPLERDRFIGPLRHYFLINPSWHIAAFCSAIVIAQQGFHISPTKPLFVIIQLTYHMAYISLWSLYVRLTIQDTTTYYQRIQVGYGTPVVCAHGALLILLLALSVEVSITSLILLNIINQCYLGIYPLLHSIIINDINKRRKIIIKNRVE